MMKKAVALGNFDGMHIGHAAVLDMALKAAGNGMIPCTLLFSEHSEKALKGFAPPMLMTDGERRRIISEKGFEIEEIDFSEICGYSPDKFVTDILRKRMNAGAVVCGYNYRFGKNAAGDAGMLRALCAENGIECFIVDKIGVDGLDVSSTVIRNLISEGNIELANRMLGRCFGFSAPVIHGAGKGSEWGFPTANQRLPDGMIMPEFGVYASKITVDGEAYSGITNIGKRPTVGTDTVLSETNIFDFNKDIYGKTADIRLVRFIRPEKKFSSFAELAEQIKADTDEAKGCDCSV